MRGGLRICRIWEGLDHGYSCRGAANLKASPLPPAPSVIVDRLTNVDDLLNRLTFDMHHFLKL